MIGVLALQGDFAAHTKAFGAVEVRLAEEIDRCETLIIPGGESTTMLKLMEGTRIEEAIEWAGVLNVLRLQLERMHGGFVPSLREYNRIWGVSSQRLDAAPRDVLVLHPGPMNRGVEIDSDVADGPHSVILNQVTNGVAIRMAVLYLLAGGRQESAEAAKQGGEA